MEQDARVELATFSLATRHSTTELILQNMAVSVGLEPTMPFGDGLTVRCNAILLTRQKIAAVKVTTAPA
jgi:hypothetical protein